MNTHPQKSTRGWWVLLAGPILFLLGIFVMSVYYGLALQGKDVEAIPNLVAASTPYQLVVIQILLWIILSRAMKRDNLTWKDIGWIVAQGQKPLREILIGAVPGVILAFLYLFILSPMLTSLQDTWDYVPAGELFTTLGSSFIPFVIANVLFAPFIEESIYRGFGLTYLLRKYSQPVAVAVSLIFFGILHWADGFWYILLTGFVAGGLFVWLRLSRKNIIAPFAAHLALNIVEAVFIILTFGY